MEFDTFSTPDTDVLASLNQAQATAVRHIDGPLLILAGPGSGKTRVVTHRIANLLQHGVPAEQILALTFTNKAADEMRNRLRNLMPDGRVWIGTFHGFCARMLRQYANFAGLDANYSIYDAGDSGRAIKLAIADADVDIAYTTPGSIANAISWAKNNLIPPDEYEPRSGSTTGTVAAKVYPEYQRQLLTANAVDFDDLLMHVAMMLRQNPELRRMLDEQFRYILVDEYQDTNFAQYAIVRALSRDFPNLAVTGDPDQSIYGWRGANLNNILDFERDFNDVAVVRLEQNYRSTPNILRLADCLIANNIKRKEKKLFTDHAEGVPVRMVIYPTGRDEADAIARTISAEIEAGRRNASDFAIFYRVNALSRSLEHALRQVGVPYQIVHGLEFYQRKEIKDVLAYLHLLHNPANDMAFLRIVNTPTRGIGKKTLDRLRDHARRNRLPLLEAARESGLIDSIAKRTATKVAKFVAMYDRMAIDARGALPDAIDAVLNESGYRDMLRFSDAEEDMNRLANIEELITDATEFDAQHPEGDSLEQFLEHSSLVADVDAWEESTDKVTLMTMHAAKGLEFPFVFIVAVEEGLLPHERSKEQNDKLEEERRLLFVGITRAEEELQLSLAQYRAFRGNQRPTVPSQFLMELPREEIEYHEPRTYAYPNEARYDASDASFDFEQFEAEEAAGADNQPVWSDEEFQQDIPPDEPVVSMESGIRTAADMMLEPSSRRVSPNLFERGTPVMHPDYGFGTVVAVSGTGVKRRVRVQFNDVNDEKNFLVAHSKLELFLPD